MGASAESVVRAFLAALTRWNVDELVGFFSENAVWTGGHTDPHEGIEAIRRQFQFVADLGAGDIRVEIKNLMASADTVMVERVDHFRVKQQDFVVDVVGVFDVDGDRRIKRWRDYYDSRLLEHQLNHAMSES